MPRETTVRDNTALVRISIKDLRRAPLYFRLRLSALPGQWNWTMNLVEPKQSYYLLWTLIKFYLKNGSIGQWLWSYVCFYVLDYDVSTVLMYVSHKVWDPTDRVTYAQAKQCFFNKNNNNLPIYLCLKTRKMSHPLVLKKNPSLHYFI